VGELVLTLSCPDRPGIVHAVSGFLFNLGANILDSAQFGDSRTGEFFMRVHFQEVGGDPGLDALRKSFAELADEFGMRWELHDASVKPRVVIMVSKIGHCLNDLLFRYKSGLLPVEIPAIVSNHMDFYQLAASYNIPFHHLPLEAGASESAKLAQEARIIAQAAGHKPSPDLAYSAPPVFLFEPHQPEQCNYKPNVILNIDEVWETKRRAFEILAAQKHLWEYYTRVALNRGMQGGRNSGRAMTYGEAYQRIFPQILEELA